MADIHLEPEGDERFNYVAHRHWMALVLRDALPVALALVAIGGFVYRSLGREVDLLGRTPPVFDLLNFGLFASALIALAIALYIYFDWRNDHLIVTNKRIVREDRTLWLAYEYETIPLDQVQNVNIRIDNVLQYVLKYGRVEVQAAGPTAPIVFDRARYPNEIQRQVMAEVQREKRTQEDKRLAATVQRRLNPSAPPVAPLRVAVEDEIQPLNPTLQMVLPLGPQLQGGTITWHRHWVILLKNLLGPFIALVAWLVALVYLPQTDLLAPTVTAGVLFVSLLAVLVYFFWQYDDWRNDLYILEPTRIVDLQRWPFGLFEDRREATLGVIQNVNASSPNLIARILGYGDVVIETAGAGGNFTFDHVPDPDRVQRVVFEYRERFRWQQREREWNNTLNIVEHYYQTRSGNPPQP